MSSSRNSGFSAGQVLLPVALIALTVFVGTAMQTADAFRSRSLLHTVKTAQDKPLEETRKLQAQLTALAQGTLKLASEGDKNAQAIVERLKKAGVTISPPKTDDKAAPAAAPEHVAMPSKP